LRTTHQGLRGNFGGEGDSKKGGTDGSKPCSSKGVLRTKGGELDLSLEGEQLQGGLTPVSRAGGVFS